MECGGHAAAFSVCRALIAPRKRRHGRRTPKLIFLLLFLAALPAFAQTDVPEVARTLMEEAQRARDAGRVDDAMDRYRRVIDVAPWLATAYINLGALQHAAGKIEEALQTFASGVEHVPNDRMLLSNAAAAAQQLGRSAEALTYIDRAIARNQRDAGLHSLRATILRALGREEDALATLQTAAQLAPRDAKVQFSLGNVLYALDRKDEAIAAYRRATSLDRGYLVAYYNLGAVLFEAKRYDEALKAYDVALQPIEQSFAKNESVDPIHARAYANLGAIYLQQQQWQQAARAYGRALMLDPKNASAHYNLGFIQFTTNALDQAEASYRAALAIDPALPLAYLHLGQIALRRGDAERAVAILTEGQPRFEGDTKIAALQTLGRAEIARGDRAAAVAAFEELVRIAPANRSVLLERLFLARERGDLAQEQTLTEEILRADPNRAELWPLRANLVVIAFRRNDLAGAKKQLDAVLANVPPSQTAAAAALRELRALLLAIDGKLDAASRDVAASKGLVAAVIDALAGRRDAAVRRLQELPAEPLARGDLGLLLWQLGRAAEAKPLLSDPLWPDVRVAAGEIAIADGDYDRAVELLSDCESANPFVLSGDVLEVNVGRSDACARAKQSLAMALLAQAAGEVERLARRGEVSSGALRPPKQLIERALDLPLGARLQAIAYFLRGNLDLLGGSLDAARDSLARATPSALPAPAASAARSYLAAMRENEEAPREQEPPEPTASSSRRTVVVFLPDAAADDKRVAEAISSMVADAASGSGVPLTPELFRRADDARAFIAANRDRVGIVIANPEFADASFTPRFQFIADGRATYRRVVIVPAASKIDSLADLRGKSVSVVEGLRDVLGSSGATPLQVPDDLTAAANVLFGKTDAAVVSEANSLLAQNANKLRVIHTSGAVGLPVIAFAPMPASERDSIIAAMRLPFTARALSRIQVSALAAIEREARPRPQPKPIEVTPVSARALGLIQTPELPAEVSYRVSVRLPALTLPEL